MKYIVDKCKYLNPFSLLASLSSVNVSACSSLEGALCMISQGLVQFFFRLQFALDNNLFCCLNSANPGTIKCPEKCPCNCESNKYQAQISASTYPDEAYTRSLLLNNTKIISLYSKAKVDLTYEHLSSQIVARCFN